MAKYIIRFWIFFFSCLLFAWTFFYGIANWNLLGELPSTQQLENPKFYQASEIYSSDGALIGTYYTENRINVEYKEINIATVEGAMEEMIKKANGKRTIPQIFFDDQHIGGYDEVRALEKENKLKDLLNN